VPIATGGEGREVGGVGGISTTQRGENAKGYKTKKNGGRKNKESIRARSLFTESYAHQNQKDYSNPSPREVIIKRRRGLAEGKRQTY